MVRDYLFEILGGKPANLDAWQMACRAVLVYGVSLAIVRIGNKRIFGKNSAFDVILGIILGSLMGRAINGSAPFGPTIAAGLALVLAHGAAGRMACHWKWAGNILKGKATQVIRNGQILADAMHDTELTQHDLEEAARSHGLRECSEIAEAWLERSGKISVIAKRELR